MERVGGEVVGNLSGTRLSVVVTNFRARAAGPTARVTAERLLRLLEIALRDEDLPAAFAASIERALRAIVSQRACHRRGLCGTTGSRHEVLSQDRLRCE